MKIRFCDVVALYLSYCYFSHESTMVAYKRLLTYEKMLLENLEGVANIDRVCENPNRNSFFSIVSKENGSIYAVLNTNDHVETDMYNHLNEIPIELYIASQMEDTLDFVGVTIQDGEFIPLKRKIALEKTTH